MTTAIPLIGNFTEAECAQWLNELQTRLPLETIVPFSLLTQKQKNDAEIAIVANPQPQELTQLPNLIWAHSLWAGVEKIVEAFKGSDLKIVRLKDPALSEAMAEAVLAWTLFLHRNMPHYKTHQQQKQWKPHPYTPANKRIVGILGLGELGSESANRLLVNKFQVAGWSRNKKQLNGVQCYSGDDGLTAILNQSDIVVCLLPLTADTRYLLNKKQFQKMKKGSSLINFSRGALIDTEALIETLTSGHLSHAVLDVFEQEPLPLTSTLWQHPQVTVLPHISAPTIPETASQIVADHIKTFRLTRAIPQTIDLIKGY